MKSCVIALAAGLLVGGIYSLLGVKSPAPPAIALVGLLGILLGEQVVPVARRLLAGGPVATAIAATPAGPAPGRPAGAGPDAA